MAIDPIGGGGAIKPKPQRILTAQAADQADGGYGGIEHQAHDHWADAGMEEQPDLEPGAIEGSERSGKGQGGQEERGGDDQAPSAHRPSAQRGPKTKKREKHRKSQTEGAVRRAMHYLVDGKMLMSLRCLCSQGVYPVASNSRQRNGSLTDSCNWRTGS